LGNNTVVVVPIIFFLFETLVVAALAGTGLVGIAVNTTFHPPATPTPGDWLGAILNFFQYAFAIIGWVASVIGTAIGVIAGTILTFLPLAILNFVVLLILVLGIAGKLPTMSG
jgi:hypothetical protein